METDYNFEGGAAPAPESTAHRAAEAGKRATEAGKRAVAEADRVWRQNPVPVVIGALALGLAIGVLIRSMEHEPRSRMDDAKERFGDAEDYLKDLVATLSKSGKKGYRKSAAAVKESLEKAVDAARGVEDDYVDPATKWFRSMWKKCCS